MKRPLSSAEVNRPGKRKVLAPVITGLTRTERAHLADVTRRIRGRTKPQRMPPPARRRTQKQINQWMKFV